MLGLSSKFKGAKCKTQLKLCIGRIKLLRNKRAMTVKELRKGIAELLRTNQEAAASIRVEHVFREEAVIDAYDGLELFCEQLSVRIQMIESSRECPHDLKESIASLVFAAPRCPDLPELIQVRTLFSSKYGKEFVAKASELMPDCGVNRQLIANLSTHPPSPQAKVEVLKKIAEEHDVSWDPEKLLNSLSAAEPDLLRGARAFLSPQSAPAQEAVSATANSAREVQDSGRSGRGSIFATSFTRKPVQQEPARAHPNVTSTQVSLPGPQGYPPPGLQLYPPEHGQRGMSDQSFPMPDSMGKLGSQHSHHPQKGASLQSQQRDAHWRPPSPRRRPPSPRRRPPSPHHRQERDDKASATASTDRPPNISFISHLPIPPQGKPIVPVESEVQHPNIMHRTPDISFISHIPSPPEGKPIVPVESEVQHPSMMHRNPIVPFPSSAKQATTRSSKSSKGQAEEVEWVVQGGHHRFAEYREERHEKTQQVRRGDGWGINLSEVQQQGARDDSGMKKERRLGKIDDDEEYRGRPLSREEEWRRQNPSSTKQTATRASNSSKGQPEDVELVEGGRHGFDERREEEMNERTQQVRQDDARGVDHVDVQQPVAEDDNGMKAASRLGKVDKVDDGDDGHRGRPVLREQEWRHQKKSGSEDGELSVDDFTDVTAAAEAAVTAAERAASAARAAARLAFKLGGQSRQELSMDATGSERRTVFEEVMTVATATDTRKSVNNSLHDRDPDAADDKTNRRMDGGCMQLREEHVVTEYLGWDEAGEARGAAAVEQAWSQGQKPWNVVGDEQPISMQAGWQARSGDSSVEDREDQSETVGRAVLSPTQTTTARSSGPESAKILDKEGASRPFEQRFHAYPATECQVGRASSQSSSGQPSGVGIGTESYPQSPSFSEPRSTSPTRGQERTTPKSVRTRHGYYAGNRSPEGSQGTTSVTARMSVLDLGKHSTSTVQQPTFRLTSNWDDDDDAAAAEVSDGKEKHRKGASKASDNFEFQSAASESEEFDELEFPSAPSGPVIVKLNK